MVEHTPWVVDGFIEYPVFESLLLEPLLPLLQQLHALLVDLGHLLPLPLLLLDHLRLPKCFLGSLHVQELVLISYKRVDVSDPIGLVSIFIVVFHLLLNDIMVRQSLRHSTASHALLLLGEDLWREAAFLHLTLLLLELGNSYLLFLPQHLLLHASLLIVHVNLDFVLLLELVHKHVFLRDHEVGSFLVIELLNELIVSLVEVFRALDLVLLQINMLELFLPVI